jgi:N-acetylmuramate 1-kinase
MSFDANERENQAREFLRRSGLEGVQRTPMSGDASTRRYERLLTASGRTLIFMDAPPAAESEPAGPETTPAERRALGYNAMARLAACRVDAFASASVFLRGLGLSAPAVEAMDVPLGFAVIEDLGDDLFARKIEAGEPATPLYASAIDVLVRLQSQAPPVWLEYDGGRWPLLPYDDLALQTGCDLFLEWWPKYAGLAPFGTEAMAEWEALWAPIRKLGDVAATGPTGVFSHRDYHAENLLWLPERAGEARVGLLDFQDAVKAHPAWDLLHLLQDARRDVDPDLADAMLTRFLDARTDLDRDAFRHAYHGLAALNAARILFIFARQVAGFGKPRYTAFMPRTWAALQFNLSQPGLEGLKAWFDRHVPMDARA